MIELLAVIVILAIIAVIAVPIILNLIDDSKKKSAEISVQNYLKAVDVAIMNKELNEDKVLDGEYNITDNGKLLDYPDDNPENDIKIKFEGQGLTSGTIIIKQNKVIETKKARIEDWFIKNWKQGETLSLKKYKEEIKVTLVTGKNFNSMIKTLANGTEIAYGKPDLAVTSIEFYSNGDLPSEPEIKEYIKEQKENKQYIDVSLDNNGTILAYCIDGKVYIISDNLISFNEDSSYMFLSFELLSNINITAINTSNVTNMESLFQNCKSLINLKFGEEFDTSQVTDMGDMFSKCNKLTSLDLSNFNTKNVEDMDNMFSYCNSLTQLNIKKLITNKVTDMEMMFFNCKLLVELDLSNFNTSNVENMRMMFANCSGLTDLNVSNFNTSDVENMGGMFNGCSNLKTLNVNNFNTINVENMSGMFRGCKLTDLDLSNFNTSRVKDMSEMFYGCNKLQKLNLVSFNTSNVTNASIMFYGVINSIEITIGCGWHSSTIDVNMFAEYGYTQEQFNKLIEDTQVSCTTS